MAAEPLFWPLYSLRMGTPDRQNQIAAVKIFARSRRPRTNRLKTYEIRKRNGQIVGPEEGVGPRGETKAKGQVFRCAKPAKMAGPRHTYGTRGWGEPLR